MQPFGHNKHGLKSEGVVPFSRGNMGHHLTRCDLGWGLPPYQVLSWSIKPFGHNRHGPKIGGLCPSFRGRGQGELGPHLAKCSMDWGPPPCQVPSWSIQPFGRNRHGPKIGGSAPFSGGGAGSPSNTMSLRPRPTSKPSGILIHPAIWPQQIWAKNWRLCPWGAASPSNTVWQGMGPTYVPSFILIHPTIWPQYTNVTDRTDRQTDNGLIAQGKLFYKRSPNNCHLITTNQIVKSIQYENSFWLHTVQINFS